MKAVMAFAGKAAGKAKAAFSGGGSGEKGGFTGKSMGNMSRGLSVLGSISEYAAQRQQASALDQQARDEEMAGRQEYIQAAEKVSAIDDAYNRLVGDQIVTAAGMGIDVGSGSVVAARQAAQSDADRERAIIRNSAETNAKMRRVRSLAYREGAKNQRFGSTIKLGLDVAQAFAS
jgi:hypothetical protein